MPDLYFEKWLMTAFDFVVALWMELDIWMYALFSYIPKSDTGKRKISKHQTLQEYYRGRLSGPTLGLFRAPSTPVQWTGRISRVFDIQNHRFAKRSRSDYQTETNQKLNMQVGLRKLSTILKIVNKVLQSTQIWIIQFNDRWLHNDT